MADADVNLTFGVGNPDDVARQLEAIINKAAKTIGDQLGKAISSSIGKAFKDAFGKINTGNAQKQFDVIDQGLRKSSKASDEFREKVEAIRKRNEELSRSFGASGLGGATSKFFDLNLRSLSALQEKLNRTDLSPELRRQFQLRFDTINAALVKESALVRRASIVQQQADLEASKAARANLETTSREKIEALRVQSRQQALASQQETTRIAAAARLELTQVQTKNRAILINERSAAAQRVELTRLFSRTVQTSLRFLTQQTQFFSRVAVQGFVGLQRAGVAAFKGISNASRSFFSVFKREQTELDQATRTSFNNRRTATDAFYRGQEERTRRSLRTQKAETLRVAQETNQGVLGIARRSGLLGFGIGAGIGLRVSQAIRSQFAVGGDFVQVLAVLQAQLGLTEEAIAKVREQSIELGNDISLPGVSAADAVNAISLLVKQFGALGDQALPAAQAAARGVLLLSRATGTAAEEAAGAIGAAVNTFGVAADQASVIADQFATTVSKAAGVGFNDLAESIKNGATVFVGLQRPALGAAGALLEFQTVIASLSKGGLIGAEAGTQVRSLLQNATRGAPQAEDALAKVAERAGVVGSVFFDQQGSARAFSESLNILRRGTEGLTDAERNLTLQRIFGTFGINAANILLAQSSEEYEQLRDRIEEAGLATGIAAAQNTGLRGALDALGSVIETQQIKTYERYQEVLGRVVIQFSELLNAFFEGRGVFGIIKTAINGVVVALGGFVVIKGAIELFGLLRRRLTLLLSPLGIFVAAIAAIAGTFNVLRRVSQPFRDALDRLGNTFTDLGNRVREALGLTSDGVSGVTESFGSRLRNVLERIGFVLAGVVNLFIDKVVPALVAVARTVRNALEPAFNAVRNIITGLFVPAIQIAWAAIDTLLLPALADLGRFLGGRIADGLRVAGEAVASFARTVQPLIQPAIDAFQALGSALGAAFRGDFSQLGAAIQGLGGGIASSARNIGTALLDGLDSLKGAIAAKFGEIFSPSNVFRGAQIVLQLVEGLGRILGLVVTDPRLLAAVAGIGAVAAVVAFRFIEGFARGVFTNIGKIADIGKDLALELGKALLDPKNLALAAGAAIVIASLFSLLRPLISSTFTKLGATGTASFAAGAAAQRGGVAGKVGAAGVAAGKSFATGFLSATKNLLGQAAVGIGKDGTLSPIRGGAARTFVSALFGGAASLDAAAKAAVERTTRKAGQAAERQLRIEWARLNSLNRALGRGTLSLGFRQLTPDILAIAQGAVQPVLDQYGKVGLAGIRLRASFQSTFAGLNSIVRGFAALLRGDLQAASQQFESFGQRVRTALQRLRAESGSLIKAIGRGVSTGVQGAVGGLFAGQALGSATDATGVVTGVAGLAATSLAIGAINPAAGVATLGVGLLTAAFTASSQKAKAYKEDVEGVTSALLEAGAQGQKGRLDVIVGKLNREIFKSERVTDFLNRIQIPTSQFAEALLAGGDAAVVLFSKLKNIPSISRSLLANGISSVEDFIDVINAGAGVAFESLSSGLAEAGFSVNETAEAFDVLEDATRVTGDAFERERRQLDRFALELDNVGENAGDAKQRITDLFSSANNFISAQIQDVNRQLSLAQAEADKAREALRLFFGGEYQQSFEGLLNRLILDSQNIGQAVAEGLSEGGDIGAAQIAETLNTRLAPQLGALAEAGAKKFSETFGGTFTSPTEGVFAGIDQAEWLKLTVIDAATKGVKDPKAKEAIANFVGGLFDGADATLVVEEAIVSSEAASDLQTQIEELTAIQLVFEIDSAQLEQQLNIATGELAKIAEAGPSFINLINTGNTLGGAVAEGLTKGLRDPKAVSEVVGAASSLAKKIEAEIRRVLRSSSPSRVMIEVGKDVGKGLAIGIGEGTSGVVFAANNLANDLGKELQVRLATSNQIIRDLGTNIGKEIAIGIADSQITIQQAVTDAVTGAFGEFTQDERVSAAIGLGFKELFERNLPTEIRASGVTELDLRQAFGGLAPALNTFVDSVGQVDTDIKNAQEKLRKGEPLSASERALAAASPTSLGADVAGSRNVQAFVAGGKVIRDYASSLLEAGRSLESVVFETKAWRDNLVNSAIAAGFSADEVAKLIDQLGLSDEALANFGKQARNLTDEATQPATSRRAEQEQKEKEEEEKRKKEQEEEERKQKEESDRKEREQEAEAQRKREDDLRERLRRLEDPRLQRNLVQNISVTVPYGDPQAVALATANRVAATANRR